MPLSIKLSILKNRVIRIERYKVMIFLYLVFIAWNVVAVSLNSDINLTPGIFRVSPKKHIALTFDDGPHPQYTEALVRILNAENVQATFFLVGKMCVKHPALVKMLYDSGMEVGNHTFSHIDLTTLSDEAIRTELALTNGIIKSITKDDVKYMRPPGGNITPHIVDMIQEAKCGVVMWTDNPGDYRPVSYETVIEAVMNQASDGGVILLHSGVYNTLSALPVIIKKLKEQNYEINTITELYARRYKENYRHITSYIKMREPGT